MILSTMKSCKKRKLVIRIISIVLAFLFTSNTIGWASEYPILTQSKDTLAVESVFKRNGLDRCEFEIVSGVHLLLSGQNLSAVNGTLTELSFLYKTPLINFEEIVELTDNSLIARFTLMGDVSKIFEGIKQRPLYIIEKIIGNEE